MWSRPRTLPRKTTQTLTHWDVYLCWGIIIHKYLAMTIRHVRLDGKPITFYYQDCIAGHLKCFSSFPAHEFECLFRSSPFLSQVQYSDAQNGKEFVTYLTLSPVQMTFHGTGSTLQASHDQVCKRANIEALTVTPKMFIFKWIHPYFL